MLLFWLGMVMVVTLLLLLLLLLAEMVVVVVVVVVELGEACDRLIHLFHFRALLPPAKPKQSRRSLLPLAQTQERRRRRQQRPVLVYQIPAWAAADADNQIFV